MRGSPESPRRSRTDATLIAALRRTTQLIASGAALEETLTAIVQHFEAAIPESLGSVHLLDASGTCLLHGAAPSLPAAYNEATHGLAIGPGVGSCGAAAFLGERVIVEEIRTHPWWEKYREIAARFELEACWSEPIFSSAGRVLGTFAIYHRRPRIPSAADLEIVALGGQLAAVAIERHRAEERQRRSEAQYRSLFESSPVGIYQTSRDGRILSANLAFASLLGYDSVDEVLALRMAADVYFAPEDRERLIAAHSEGAWQHEIDITWKRRDGSPIEVRLNTSIFDGAIGDEVAFEGFVTDVSEQKRSERILRESEDRYRDLVEHSRDLICTHDLEGRILSFNRWTADSLGYSDAELSRMNVRDIVTPEYRPQFDAYLEEVTTRGAARGTLLIETRSGERRIWAYDNSLRTEGVDRPLVRGLGHDITESVQAKRLQSAVYRIAESGHAAASLPELFASIHGIVGRLLPARNFFVALHDSARDCLTFPYYVDEMDPAPPPHEPSPVEGLAGRVLRSGEALLIASDERSPHFEPEERVIGSQSLDWLGVPLRATGNIVGVLAVQSYSGEVRYSERDKAVLQFVSNQVASTIARKLAETALRESEARYQRVIDNIGDALIVDDLEGRVVFANDRFLELFGLERRDLDGLVLEDYVAPAERAALRERHDRRMRGEEAPALFEYEGVRKDGSSLWIEVRVSRVVENGRLVGTQSAMRDVTERRQAEQARQVLEEHLRQALKMEAVGSLAGGVAHDFNNMLAVILGNTEMALAEIDDRHPLAATLGEIRLATARSIELTTQLLAFARKQTIQPRELDLNETVASMLKMLRRLVGETLDLVWTPGPGLWPVLVDPVQLDQVLANLTVNARDAIEGHGTVWIETRNVVVGPQAETSASKLVPGDYVVLQVRDSGCGMDEPTQRRIFEPFFTTKPVGKGTGMGLATVFGIVQQNRGEIEVESSPGRGATFRIYLPRIEPRARPDPHPAEPAAAPGSETILLVEDEAWVLALSRRILERAGYRVLTARDPAEALALLDGGGEPIQLLVTDVMLPGMSGKELTEALRARMPGLRCLYISGYTADVIAHEGVLEDDLHFLGKPFSIAALVAKVREVLDA